MAKAKSYSNYAEVVGNVANIYQKSEKTGELRFKIATHRSYTRKDGTKAEETQFLPVLVRPNRKWAKQDVIEKGKFIRVIGHLEDNSYKAEDGTWKGGFEICADKIVELKKREDGQAVAAETGEPIDIMDGTEIEEA